MYTLTREEEDLVQSYNHNWEQDNLSYLKKRIKRALINDPLKDEICYYCKSPIDTGTTPGDIEHIIHKSTYTLFSFVPRNLTLACDRCNTSKGAKDVLLQSLPSTYAVNNYPMNSRDYKIVHAHIDSYEDYIKIQNYIFFVGIDQYDKGINTIKYCSLNRLDLALSKIKQVKNCFGISNSVKNILKAKGNRIQQILTEIEHQLSRSTREEMFKSIVDINKEESAIIITNHLEKINNLTTQLTRENIEVFKRFLTAFSVMKNYYDFVTYLNSLSMLLPQLIPYNLEEIYRVPGKLMLSKNGIDELEILLNTQTLKYLQNASKIKLLYQINHLKAEDLTELSFILNNMDIIISVMNIIRLIFDDQIIMRQLPGLDEVIVRKLREDVQNVYKYASFNPQIVIMHNLEYYYHEIFTGMNRDLFNKSKKLAGQIDALIK